LIRKLETGILGEDLIRGGGFDTGEEDLILERRI
jgi:hypothetical protein